jgi:carbonic anhydrase
MGFDDLLAANTQYAASFTDTGMAGAAARELAVLTCIDSRIDPLKVLGLAPGDAKIVRNAGARVTDDALRSLTLAHNLLGAKRICVIAHTECAMVGTSEDELRARVRRAANVDACDIDLLTVDDQLATLASDLERIRTSPLLKGVTDLGGFIFNVRTGQLTQVI